VNPQNPNFYVNDLTPRTFAVKSNFRNSGSPPAPGTPAIGEELVNGGTVVSFPTTFSTGATTGSFYRYVTWRNDPACAATGCATTNRDSKRIVLAVVLDSGGGSGAAKPVWLSSIVNDPTARPPGEPAPVSAAPVGAQPFFLYDTSCKETARQEPASRSVRNTSEATKFGTCAGTGLADKPALMGPAGVPGSAGVTPPFHDYSTDYLTTAGGGAPAPRTNPQGLALQRPDATASGCLTDYTTAQRDVRKFAVHTWATTPFTAAFSTPTTGVRSAFSFTTEAVNRQPGERTLCLTLRRLRNDGTLQTLAATSYTQANWPTEPTELSFQFEHGNFTLLASERLLLTVALTSASSGDINVHLDHPSRQSFLTVPTTTPLP
jgi:hypothetical protein